MFLPLQYFHAAAHPFKAGVLTLIPFIGTLGLIAGLVIGTLQRKRELFLFFLPFVASECYCSIALFFHGQLHGNATVAPVCLFAFLEFLLIAYVAYKCRRASISTVVLTVFSLSMPGSLISSAKWLGPIPGSDLDTTHFAHSDQARCRNVRCIRSRICHRRGLGTSCRHCS